jgi:hypothetical protein
MLTAEHQTWQEKFAKEKAADDIRWQNYTTQMAQHNKEHTEWTTSNKIWWAERAKKDEANDIWWKEHNAYMVKFEAEKAERERRELVTEQIIADMKQGIPLPENASEEQKQEYLHWKHYLGDDYVSDPDSYDMCDSDEENSNKRPLSDEDSTVQANKKVNTNN